MPDIALTRPETAAIGGALEGAERTTRETMLWVADRRHPDQIINQVKDEADFRGRDVVSNDGYAQGIVDLNRDNIVGSQFRLNSQPNWTVLQQLYSTRFDEKWAEEFQVAAEEKFNLMADSGGCYLDASRRNTFTSLVRMAVAGFVYTGEVLATAEWIREVGRPFNTAIQMVAPTRLSNPDGKEDDQFLRRGVRRDLRGRPTGYFIRIGYPTQWYMGTDTFRWAFVPAEKPWGRRQVIHIIDSIQPDQTRGVAKLVAVLKDIKMTKKFEEIVLQNAVINASYAATIESELPKEVIAAAMGGGGLDPNASFLNVIGSYLTSLNSYLSEANGVAVDGAKMPHLFPGTKLNMQTLGTPGGVGTEFEVSLLRHIAAGLGISYEEFARDFSRTNYSSARAAMMTTWKHMMGTKKFVADKFADEVYSLWLEEDMNAGNMPMPRGFTSEVWYRPWGKECFTSCDWIGAGRGQIDELKETQAALLRVKGGMSTREYEIAKQGGDWRKVFRQLNREAKLQADLDLAFDQNVQKDGSTSGQTVMQDTPPSNTNAVSLNQLTEAFAEAISLMPAPVVTVPQPVVNVAQPTVNVAQPVVNVPQPIVNVHLPMKGVERTRVTKHDASGRILEFEREEVDA